MFTNKQLIEIARSLPQPDDYFNGVDWGGEILPREIVSFCRMAQDHRTSGWDGISAKAGRYDQHSRYVLLVALEGNGSMGVETNTRQIHKEEAHLLFPHQIHYYIDLPEKFTWLYVTFDLEGPARQILELWRSGGRKMNDHAMSLLVEFLTEFQNGDGLQSSIALGKVFEAMETAEPAQNKADRIPTLWHRSRNTSWKTSRMISLCRPFQGRWGSLKATCAQFFATEPEFPWVTSCDRSVLCGLLIF